MSVAPARRVLSLALAAALVVAAPLTLSGCAVVEGIIEEQTGGDVDLGGDTIPADFPAEVPLIEGTVVNGSAITGSGGEKVWNVLLNVTDPAAPETITAQLEGAGFTSTGAGGSTDSGSSLAYVKGDLVVNVLLAPTDEGWTANYTVARSAS